MKKIIVLAMLPLLAFVVGVYAAQVQVPRPAEGSQGLNYGSTVCVEKNGVLVGECQHNTFTNYGKNITMERLFDGIGAAPSYISLGNSTGFNTSSINVTNEVEVNDCSGLQRAIGTVTKVASPISSGNISIAKTFTSACAANVMVNTTGLYNATGAGAFLFAGNSFTAVTLSNADQVTITWYVWVA